MRTRYTVASRKRRKKVLQRAKGFHGARSLRIKTAREAVMHAPGISTGTGEIERGITGHYG